MRKEKSNIGRKIRRFSIRRKYRDELFLRVFRDKRDLLALYNALNRTSYENPDELRITTLEDAIYLSFKNDVSFIIASTLNLYEHQSTVNPNMPLRGIIYFARLYEGYVKENQCDIYGRKLVELPLPVYIVFYNGTEPLPEEEFLHLSDSFRESMEKNPSLKPAIECDVRVLNINHGHNRELLEACKRLHDYAYFIDCVNQNLNRRMGRKDAIETAIDECIEKDILTDILIKQKAQVISMLLTEYDKKLHEKTLKSEGYEEGYGTGYDSGYDKRLEDMVCKKVSKGHTIEQIAEALEEDIETIRRICDEIK